MKTLLKVLILVLLLTACAPVATDQPEIPATDSYPNPSYPKPSYPNDDTPPDLTPAQQAALTLLSQTLRLPAAQLAILSTEAVTWPNGCLGVERPGMICTQAVVEGYRILIEADGKQYEVRTNQTGSMALIASGVEPGSLIEVVLIRQLAENLGLQEAGISVVSNEAVEFADACLGVAMQDVMCAQVIVPGRIVVLEADGVQYEYHVSDDGRLIQPATLALTWSRDGGIAGFCDRLTVFRSGEVYGNSCKSQTGGTMGTFSSLLSDEEIAQLQGWLEEYGSVSIEASDPLGVSDRMTLSLNLYGNGSAKPLKAEEDRLFDWAQTLYQKLYE
ncbi:MAG: hypothetical protein HXY42_01885 [Chloroflexi bacterium]|nr:hypothetical protein [Chloroflexota bacterium]